MNDNELVKKLNNLKSIEPDNEWKKNYRQILFSQISASRPVLTPKSDMAIIWEIIMPRQILINLAKPVWLASVASILILIVGIGSVYASKNSKPGDSLYIAKIISEKAQLAMTFGEKDKAQLGVEFAANRAKEMIQVLKDSDQTGETANNKLQTLSQNFKKEISQVKKRLSTMKKAVGEQAKNDESQVFGANLGKSEQRMEIAEPAGTVEEGKVNPPTQTVVGKSAADSATSTAENVNRAGQMLDEAEKLVEEKNLDSAINKLEEVNKVIEDAGQVKGASEMASSTD